VQEISGPEPLLPPSVGPVSRPFPNKRNWERFVVGRRKESRLAQTYCSVAPLVLLIPDHGKLGLLRFVVSGMALAALVSTPASVRRHFRLPITLVFLCGWALLSIVWSVDVSASKKRVLGLLMMSLVGWSAGALLPSERLLPKIAQFARAVVALCYLEIVLVPAWASRTALDGAPGYRCSFQHKNALGMFAWMAFVVFATEGRTHWKFWAGAAVGLVVLSHSSTAVAAFVTVAGVASFFAALRSIRPGLRRSFVVVSALLGVLLGLSLFFIDPALLTTVFGRDATFTGRTRIWSAVMQAIGRKPWIGHGFGGIWDDATPDSTRIWFATGFRAYHAHQGYLDFWLQLGIVGLVGVLCFLGGALVRSVSWLRRDRKGAWMPLIIIGLMTTALAESEPFLNGGWAVMVLLVSAVYRNTRRSGATRVAGTPSLDLTASRDGASHPNVVSGQTL
jgi:exopolysaccharide production protein ExoQ